MMIPRNVVAYQLKIKHGKGSRKTPEDAPRNKKSNTTVQEGFNETINNTFAYVATIHIV